MKHILSLHDFLIKESIKIGDNTNLGIVEDETKTQYYIKGTWFHKSLVKPLESPILKEPLRNRGRISPDLVISAFKNVIEPAKVERYTNIMSHDEIHHNFPPIKGFPIIIGEDDIKRYEMFLNKKYITKKDIGKYAWVTTDGHHRTLAALNVGLPYLETKLDSVYLGDEKDYIEI